MLTNQRRPIQPEVELQVRKLLRRPEVSARQIREVAKRLHGWQPAVSAIEQVQGYLDLAHAIESIRAEIAKSDQRLTFVANTLTVTLARLYAAYMPVENSCLLKLQEYEAVTQRSSDDWLHAKVSVLFRAYARRAYAVELLRLQMPIDEQATAELVALGIDDIQKVIEDLAAALAEQRAYGVKPSMFQDGIGHADEDVWVFNDGYDMTTSLLDFVQWERPLAVTMLASRRQVRSLTPSAHKHGEFTSIHFGFQDKLTATIRASGEFTVDVEIGAVPLYEYFVQADRRKAYDLFRLTHLLRLYNLVVPQYVAPGLKVPDWPELPKATSDRRKHRQQLQGGLRRLLLPRLRVLEQPEAIRAALEVELDEAEELTEALTTGKARHWVTGFVRKLPNPNGQATNEARRLAWIERGIALKPGQTYVRMHERGTKPNLATGHRAIVRSP